MKLFILILASLIFSVGHTELKANKAQVVNGQFKNIQPIEKKGIFSLLKWRWGSLKNSIEWPEFKNTAQYKVTKKRSKKPIVTIINHATVLVQMDNVNILTDPQYAKRASPINWAGPERVVNPGIKFDDLPPIDVVVISHNHYDHLNIDTLVRLNKKFSPLFIVGVNTKALLEKYDIKNVVELNWWQHYEKNNVKIYFVPAQHWSARGLFDRNKMLWGGFYFTGSKKIYFAGDTGYGNFFKLIKKELGPPDIALLPIGAYEPRWFMKDQHLNPEDAVKAFIALGAKKAIGIHFGTFKLTDEGINDPIKELNKALAKYKISRESFVVPIFGKAY